MEANTSPAIEIESLSKSYSSLAIETLGLSITYRPAFGQRRQHTEVTIASSQSFLTVSDETHTEEGEHDLHTLSDDIRPG
jgi:hypothetical protein